jgi:hypothetical protein
MKRAGLAIAALLIASAGLFAGLGGSASGDPTFLPARSSAGFSWLRAARTPNSWRVLRVPGSPAALSYPGSWRRTQSDAGTVTATLKSGDGEIVGYLNATPQQGDETLANWKRFRPGHNAGEGDREIRLLGAANDLRFRRGTGSCVIEDYTTSSGNRYREISCLVRGRRASSVVVGAAPPAQWPSQRAAIERAISSFTT